jgi:hypothetical protein
MKGSDMMVKVYIRYLRYAFSFFATVGFGFTLGN